MNLVLCGMMGCGKSTVGVRLAELTARKYCDTDAVIVEKYGRIADIFERFGEDYFRDLETQTIKELVRFDDLVIATGGGLILRKENVELLKSNGKIIFLRAKEETLFTRLQADKERPLLQNAEDLSARIRKLLAEREEHYLNASDFVLDVDEKTPEGIAGEIIKWIGQV